MICLYGCCCCSPKVGEALRAITHQEWVDLMEKVFKISLEILTIIKVGNMNSFLFLLSTLIIYICCNLHVIGKKPILPSKREG